MSFALPAELRVAIAKAAQRDKGTLVALSTVSREWVDPAQMSLFEALEAAIEDGLSIQTLLSLLRSSPRLATYVYKLGLFGRIRYGYSKPQFQVSEILDLVALIPRMHTLSFHWCQMKGVYRDLPETAPRRFTPCRLSLSFLSLKDIAFDILASRLTISELCVHRDVLWLASPSPRKPIEPANFESIVALDVVRTTMPTHYGNCVVADDILATAFNAVTSCGIEFRLTGLPLWESANEFLRQEGRHIQHLRLDYSNLLTSKDDLQQNGTGDALRYRSFKARFRFPVLSNCCPSLKTLTLTLRVKHEKPQVTVTHRVVQWHTALYQLSSAPRTLTGITIGIPYPQKNETRREAATTLDLLDWKAWDEVLGRFGCLERLCFRRAGRASQAPPGVFEESSAPATPSDVFSETRVVNMRLFLTDKLPATSGRGIICFD